MKLNFTKLFLSIAILTNAMPLFAMEKEAEQPSEYLTILNSAIPLFMRIREGNEPNIQIIKNDANASQYTIAGNQETFLFPQNTKIRIKLDSIDWPLRLRWWPAQSRPDLGIKEYQPTSDIDENGNSTRTSDNNVKKSIFSLAINKENLLETPDRYIELYIKPDNTIDGMRSPTEPKKGYTTIPMIRAGYGKGVR